MTTRLPTLSVPAQQSVIYTVPTRVPTVVEPIVPIVPIETISPIIRVNSEYCKILNIYADIALSDENVTLEDILSPDKLYTFFRSILRENDAELQSELQTAVKFYLDQYGIDLSKFKPTDGYWQSGEHRFYSYIKKGDYHGIRISGNCCSLSNSTCIEGGFVLVVGAPGIIARGSYGKEIGENISPGSIIYFGYYVFIEENNKGTIYHFRSNSPSRTSVEVPLTWNLDVYDYKSTSWGKSIGSAIIEKKNNRLIQNRKALLTTTSYVPSVATTTAPVGIRQTRSVTTVRNNEPFPLIVNEVPVASSSQTNLITSTSDVPTYAPIIKEELVDIQQLANLSAILISRSVITFLM